MRNVVFVLLIGGLLTILLGVGLLVSVPAAFAQDPAEYVGARDCAGCHGGLARAHADTPHANALAKGTDAIVADFSTGADLRTVTFPGDTTARPFTTDDVAYTVGAGRRVQRYVYEVDRGTYRLFPAQWNAVTGQWEPYRPAENWDDPAYDFGTRCAGCHVTGYNAQRVRWEDDGVQCEACHGPGSLHADLADDAGDSPSDRELQRLRAAIVVSADAQICGQCHSQGRASSGGFYFPVGYLPGSGALTQDYALVAPDDTAHWWATGHASQPNMQFNEWLRSAHAAGIAAVRDSDYAADDCLTCHSSDYRMVDAIRADTDRDGDPPDALTLQTAQFGITCITCHDQHADTPVPNQLAADPYTLCVTCHSDSSPDQLHHPVQQMFEGITIVPDVPGFPSGHFAADDGPRCVTCHMPQVPIDGFIYPSHLLTVIFPGQVVPGLQDSCMGCHNLETDAVNMQQLIDDIQSDTQARLDAAQAALRDDSPDWVRTALGFIVGDGSLGIHNYAYTDDLLDAVELALGLDNTGGTQP